MDFGMCKDDKGEAMVKGKAIVNGMKTEVVFQPECGGIKDAMCPIPPPVSYAYADANIIDCLNKMMPTAKLTCTKMLKEAFGCDDTCKKCTKTINLMATDVPEPQKSVYTAILNEIFKQMTAVQADFKKAVGDACKISDS
jgi:hypothetical protein